VQEGKLLTAVQQQTPEPVYALQGTLGKAERQNFSTFIVTVDGKAYALVGQTPEIEQKITALRDQGSNTVAKVWGTLYPQGRVSATPEIVVTSILPGDNAQAQPQPTPQPTQPIATVRNASINVRVGPGTNYGAVGTLNQGDTCTILGREPANAWWEVQCANGLTGWLFQQLVDTTGNTATVPVVAAPPPPAPPPAPPTPTVYYGWKTSWWKNTDLSGTPERIIDSPNVDWDWGNGPPEWPDHFSTRFERTINFNPGTYRFTARADDGVRVFIDNQLVINEWHISSGNVEYTADRAMFGNQTVRVEHFEDTGLAFIHFNFFPLANTTIDGGGSGEWQVNYYNNPDLSGSPALVRREPRSSYPLDVDWGNGSPASGIVNDDNFSARWVGTFYFDEGNYVFQTRSDDGVRVYIDGLRVIDAWSDGFKEPSNQFRRLGGGNHQVTIEYYERGGTAFNRVWWWRTGSGSGGNNGGGIPPNRDQ
jgi:hypothetical protein